MPDTPDFLDPVAPLAYAPLEGPSAICVFDLLPGNKDEPIRCILHHTTIHFDQYAYDALSYV